MESFKLWILSVCGATAITSLCKLFLTKSKLQKITNVFLSVFVLLYTILPIQNINLDIDNLFKENTDDNSYISFYQEGYESVVSESIMNVCYENNINVISVEIDSYIDEDSNLVITNLCVDIEDDSLMSYTKDIIKKSLNFEVDVI